MSKRYFDHLARDGLLVLLAFLVVIPITVSGEEKISLGFNVGLEQVQMDSKFEPIRQYIPIPLVKGDFDYYSVEVPIVAFKEESSPWGKIVGINSTSIQYRPSTIAQINSTTRYKTIYEASTVYAYGGVQYWWKNLWMLNGNVTGALAVAETVYTKAREYQKLTANSDGSTEYKYMSVEKDYKVDYGFGAILGAGLFLPIGESSEIGFQGTCFFSRTNLKLPNGLQIDPSFVAIQLVYLYGFE